MSDGIIPSLLMEALVHSLFKKPLLDPSILDNFCPVSNLPFWGKMIEKVTAEQLKRALDEADFNQDLSSMVLCYFASFFRPISVGSDW